MYGEQTNDYKHLKKKLKLRSKWTFFYFFFSYSFVIFTYSEVLQGGHIFRFETLNTENG